MHHQQFVYRQQKSHELRVNVSWGKGVHTNTQRSKLACHATSHLQNRGFTGIIWNPGMVLSQSVVEINYIAEEVRLLGSWCCHSSMQSKWCSQDVWISPFASQQLGLWTRRHWCWHPQPAPEHATFKRECKEWWKLTNLPELVRRIV